MKNFASSNQVKNSLMTVRQLGTGAAYESGVEARHHYDAVVENLVADYKENNNNMPPSDYDMAKIVDIATKRANAVFASYESAPKLIPVMYTGIANSIGFSHLGPIIVFVSHFSL